MFSAALLDSSEGPRFEPRKFAVVLPKIVTDPFALMVTGFVLVGVFVPVPENIRL